MKQFAYIKVIFLPCFKGVNLKSGHSFLSLALLAVFLYSPSALVVSCYNRQPRLLFQNAIAVSHIKNYS